MVRSVSNVSAIGLTGDNGIFEESRVNLATVIRNERFVFTDLRQVFAMANEQKSGDELAGLAATTERQRVAAKRVLSQLTLQEIVDHPLIDPDIDEVSRLILDRHDRQAFESYRSWTVGEFRDWILDDQTGGPSWPRPVPASLRKSRRRRRS